MGSQAGTRVPMSRATSLLKAPWGPGKGQALGWGNFSTDRWQEEIRGDQSPLWNLGLGGLHAEWPHHTQEALGGSEIYKFCGLHAQARGTCTEMSQVGGWLGLLCQSTLQGKGRQLSGNPGREG